MLDHISFAVNDFQESAKFYDGTLKILGIERYTTFETQERKVIGYGMNNRPYFWIVSDQNSNEHETVGKALGFHVAFKATGVESVKAWYQKCLELGGIDNGAPGPRIKYHPGLFWCFYHRPKWMENRSCTA